MHTIELQERLQPLDLSAQLAQTTDLNEQWQIIHGTEAGDPAKLRGVAESCQLLDFAANPECTSRYLRAYALEIGYADLSRAARAGETVPEKYHSALAKIGSVLPPLYRSSDLRSMLTYARAPDGMWFHDYPDDINPGSYYLSYHEFFTRQAGKEGVDPRNIVPNKETEVICDAIPVAAGMFLQDAAGVGPRGLNALSPAMANEALDLFLDFNAPDYREKIDHFRETAKLARYTSHAGIEFDAPIEFLHNLPEVERAEYVQALNELYDSAMGLQEAFPPEMDKSIVDGARKLFARSLFAVKHHIEHGGHTGGEIELIGKDEPLRVRMDGQEPLELIRVLSTALNKLQTTVTSPNLQTIKVSDTNRDFAKYRLVDSASTLPPSINVQIRPFAGARFDKDYEYGTNGKGAAASMGYTIQMDNESLLSIFKGRKTGNVIDIHLDLEPAAHAGEAPDKPADADVISVDVGSLFAGDTLNGRVARMLAWGDTLWSRETNKRAYLNHAKPLKTPYNNPDAFAAALYRKHLGFEAIRMNKRSARRYTAGVAGRLATTS